MENQHSRIRFSLLYGFVLVAAYIAAKFAYYGIPSLTKILSPAGAAGIQQMLCLAAVLLAVTNIDIINRLLRRMGLFPISSWVETLSLQIYLVHFYVAQALIPIEINWQAQIGIFFCLTLVFSQATQWITKIPRALRKLWATPV